MKIRLSGFTRESIVDGPGVRIVFFFQGCLHHCPFCQNPTTWPFEGGADIDIEEIDKVLSECTKTSSGVTLSGGDPFANLDASIAVAELCKKYKYNLICYTGYTIEEILELSQKDERYITLLRKIDTLVDGRFILSLKSYDINSRGSRNQLCIDVQATLMKKEIVLYEKMMDMSFYADEEVDTF